MVGFAALVVTAVLIFSHGCAPVPDNTCRTTAHLKVDESYQLAAEATGGIAFNLQGPELGAVTMIDVDHQLGGRTQDPDTGIAEGPAHLIKVRRKFSAMPESILFYVDSTIKKLYVFLHSTEPMNASLLYPDGSLVAVGSAPRARFEQYSSGCITLLDEIPPGEWTFRIETSGVVSVHVQGRSAIRFKSFEYVYWGEPPAYQGLFPTANRPVAGEDHRALATLFGGEAYASIREFQIRSLTGRILATLETDPAPARDYPIGPFEVPREMSRIYVIGADSQGFPFQRMYSHTIEGSFDPTDPQGTDSLGTPSLISAAVVNNIEVARTLINSGADVNGKSEAGDTALMSAAQHADGEILALLLENGADVNAVTKYHGTAVFRATVARDAETVRKLLQHGATADIRDGSGYTAVEWAQKQGYGEIVELLTGVSR